MNEVDRFVETLVNKKIALGHEIAELKRELAALKNEQDKEAK